MSTRKYKTPKTILKAALKLLEKGGWIQYDYENAEGAHCLVGAIAAVSVGGINGEESEAAFRLLGFKPDNDWDVLEAHVTNWNDKPSRRFKHVKARFEKAIGQ